jgi:hypothetical protein
MPNSTAVSAATAAAKPSTRASSDTSRNGCALPNTMRPMASTPSPDSSATISRLP